MHLQNSMRGSVTLSKPTKVFDVEQVKKNFPALEYRDKEGQSIVYLDNSATTQKPQCVIDTLVDFYKHNNSNVHRSFYDLGAHATAAYEGTRELLAQFIGALSPEEIVFTRGATEATNCLAEIIGQRYFKEGDEVIVSELEHHSNLIPWLMQQKKRGIHVKAWPVNERGDLRLELLESLLTPRTKLLAVTQISNALGTVPPLKEIIQKAHANGALVLVDAAQALAHMRLNVQDLDCDFLVGSGHKSYGPMGVGFFYGKRKWLEDLPPYHGGGTMMEFVSMENFTVAEIPSRFEAGTPPVADVVGFGAALRYLQQFDWNSLIAHEDEVIRYAEDKLGALPHVTIVGRPKKKAAVVSFSVENVHPHDISSIVNTKNVALRAGYHCCQPLMHRLGAKGGVVRASLGLYNTREDVDRLADAVRLALHVFKL